MIMCRFARRHAPDSRKFSLSTTLRKLDGHTPILLHAVRVIDVDSLGTVMQGALAWKPTQAITARLDGRVLKGVGGPEREQDYDRPTSS